MNRRAWFAALLLAWLPVAGWAIEARIETTLEGDGQVWVGDKAVIRLELISDGFSFSGQRFDLPSIPGALLIQVDTTALKSTRQVDGESWQALGYRFRLYPQRAGVVEVPPIGVSFSVSAGYGKEPSEFRFQTEPLRVEARLPPGAQPGETLVSARQLEVNTSWQPQPGAEVKVGDAFTRTITLRAPDVPGMVLPATPAPPVEGMGVYPADPLVNDQVDRGSLTGGRTDGVTYVCEREGSYSIPAQIIRWWNPDTNQIRQAEVPGVELKVAPNPALQAETAVAAEEAALDWRIWLAAGAGLLALIGFGRWLWPRLARRRQARRAAYAASEDAAFKALRKACRSGSATETYNALSTWLRRWQGLRSTAELAKRYLDPGLAAELGKLQRAVVDPQAEWSGRELFATLKRVRKTAGRKEPALARGAPLGPLNPPALPME